MIRNALKRLWRIRFLTTFLITLPLFFIIGGYILEAYINFSSYKDKANPKMELTLIRSHFFIHNVLKREWINWTSPKVKEKSLLKSFYITVNPKDIDKLNANLPKSGKTQYVTAFMKVSDSNKKRKIKLRYRGDNNYHWLYPQKSLRIKTKKKKIYNMERKFNLINLPHLWSLIDCVNYDLSRELGLISPEFFPVRVFINGKYMGAYMYLSQVNESTLRKHKLMPGSIYKGDGAPVGKDGVSTLWKDEKYWKKIGSRNKEQKNNREDIKFFLKAINTYNHVDFYHFVNTYLNKDNYYNFFALDVIFDSGHHTFHHNHKIYFDPYKGKFEPIAWDLRYWQHTGRKDFSLYPLLNRIKLNPIIESERDQVSYQLLKLYDFKVEQLMKRLNYYKNLIYEDLNSDTLRDTGKVVPIISLIWISVPFSMNEFNKTLEKYVNVLIARQLYLIDLYNDTRISWNIVNKNNRFKQLLFKVSGNSPGMINLNELIPNKSTKVYRDANLNGILDKSDKLLDQRDLASEMLYPGRKKVPHPYLHLKNHVMLLGKEIIKNAPLYYSYIVDGNINSMNTLKYKNAITGASETANYESFKMLKEADSIHPWKLPVYQKKHTILSGVIHVKDNMIFAKHHTVSILPGTKFILYPKKSIYFYGKVIAEGTKNRPIQFIAKNKNRPWGIVAVQGKSASGSRFKYCEFHNGSVDKRNLIHYTAQFNIHDLDDFEISHCTIGRNYIGDDSMHVAYSKGIIKDCIFTNARSDALDIDISEVEISNSIFLNNGNDALDFMTSKAKIVNSIFINNKDKGISIGEWSDVILKNDFFYRCNIAIEVKDKSVAKLENILIVDSIKKAIHLYNKNWRYDKGGTINADSINIVGDNKIVKKDKKSKVNIKKIENNFPPLDKFIFLKKKLQLNSDWSKLKEKISEYVKHYEL